MNGRGSRRARTWKRVLVAVSTVLGAVAVWGVGLEPRLLDVEREDVLVPGLPRDWDGERVAVLGDFQVGMWLDNVETIRKAVAAAIRARPRAVLLLGDFIYAREGEPDEKMAELQPILALLREAGVPTYAVLGNHDFGQDTPEDAPDAARAAVVRRRLEAVGVQVLANEVATVRPERGAAPLHVVGIGPVWPGVSAPRQAIAAVPPGAPRVVFMHNPDSFQQLPPGMAPFAIAGHTHGGQVRIPFMPHWSWLTLVKGTEAVDGWIPADDRAAGNRLYVNRGIGFSGLPVRINCPPELTVFTLRAYEPGG